MGNVTTSWHHVATDEIHSEGNKITSMVFLLKIRQTQIKGHSKKILGQYSSNKLFARKTKTD